MSPRKGSSISEGNSREPVVEVEVNQAYSRLSTTHGHITDCKLDSVVYAGVACCGWKSWSVHKPVVVLSAILLT